MKAIVVLLSLWIMAFSCQVNALKFVHNETELVLSNEELANNSNVTHQMFGPFRYADVVFEGYDLSKLLQHTLNVTAKSIRVSALDGYQMVLDDVDTRPLMLVVKENGKTLSIREHGPARIIEKDYGGRDWRNISLFDDWVWMIQEIEVLDE